MARLVCAFGSSHSVMLGCELEDWLTKFASADRVLPFYDRRGKVLSFDELLAQAPPDAAQYVTPEAITGRFHETQQALEHMKQRLQASKLDVLVILGDDQHELFRDELMPSVGIYYGATIRNAARTELPREQWYKRAQMRRHLIGPFIQFTVAQRSFAQPEGFVIRRARDLSFKQFDDRLVRRVRRGRVVIFDDQ